MAFFEANFYSESLGFQTTVNVIMPQRSTSGQIGVEGNAGNGEYKCVYLLHGLSDDHSIWLRRTSIERYADEFGICVVMPFGGKGFYTDMKYGEKYYTYISEELPRLMEEFFGISQKRENNFIAGLSMGGYGALKIGLKNPDRYSACAGLSAVADIRGWTQVCPDLMVSIFGENPQVPDSEDLFCIAEETNKLAVKPRVYMGVGTEDFLYDGNVELRKKFETLDFDYTYRESAGTHCWTFWDEYIQYVLAWMFGDK